MPTPPTRPAAGRAVAGSLVAWLSWLAAPASAQAPVVISDPTLPDGDWAATVEAVTGGASATAERLTLGGNPGSHRFMRHTMAAPSHLFVRHLYLGRAYDPGTEGAIQAIDLAIDQLEIAPPFTGAAVGTGFFLVQDGRIHYATTGTFANLEWSTTRSRCLGPADFTPENGVPVDFSANGGPIRFGFRRGNTNDSTTFTYAVQHAADNFRVVLYRAGGPGCASEPPDLRISKTDGNVGWSERPLIPYQITVANLGGPATGVILRETVPVRTDFVAASSTPGWQCSPGTGEDAACTLPLGTLERDATRQVVFAVRVRPDTNPAFEVFNLASVNPEDSDCTFQETSGPECDNPVSCCILAFLNSGGEETCGQFVCDGAPASVITCSQNPEDEDRWAVPGRLGAAVTSFAAPPPAGHPPGGGQGVAAGRGSRSARVAVEPPERLDMHLLYRLRDRIFHRSPGGRRATDLYYHHSPELVMMAITDSTFRGAAYEAIVAWQPNLRALVEGRGSTVDVTEDLVDRIDTALDLALGLAGPELQAAITAERAALDLDGWVGLDLDTAVARLDRLSCEPSAGVLCLKDGRFRVEASWRTATGQSGHGTAVPLTGDTGAYWFFSSANVEVIVKVIDACGLFDRFWVFAGGLTDVDVRLTVTDTASGARREYTSTLGTPFQPLQDTSAFATCP